MRGFNYKRNVEDSSSLADADCPPSSFLFIFVPTKSRVNQSIKEESQPTVFLSLLLHEYPCVVSIRTYLGVKYAPRVRQFGVRPCGALVILRRHLEARVRFCRAGLSSLVCW